MSTVDDPHTFRMGLMQHLRELRKRLIISLIAVTLGAIVAYLYAGQIFAILCAPYFASFPNSPLIGTSPAEAWLLKLKVSVFAGAILTSPLLFYQLWLFVAPGLYQTEQRLVVPFVILSTVLFTLGAYFCYELALPLSLRFFYEEFRSIGITPTIKISDHLSMSITALLGFGVVFELPLLSFFLTRAGVCDHTFLLHHFRHAVVIIFVVAAVLTPPDVMTQFMMAGPLLILYGISIGVAYLASKRSNAQLST